MEDFNADARRRASKYSYNSRLTLPGVGITSLAWQFPKLIRGGHNHDVRSDIACFVCADDVRTHRRDDVTKRSCSVATFFNPTAALLPLIWVAGASAQELAPQPHLAPPQLSEKDVAAELALPSAGDWLQTGR